MQERSAMTNMDLKVYMEHLKNNPRFTGAMLRLVEEDLKYGLTPEETEEYTAKKLDYTQMKVYSVCLRNGYGREVMDAVTREGLTGEQMAVALEFYEKGVKLETIKEITQNTGQTAFTMKKLFQDIMKNLDAAQKKADTGEAYAGELLNRISEAVEKIHFQEKRYDALNEKLKELQAAKQGTQDLDSLQSQLADRDRLLENQQDQINAARAEIARLKGEMEEAERKRRVMERSTDKDMQPESTGGFYGKALETEQPGADTAVSQNNNPAIDNPSARHMEYRTALVDEYGRTVQMVPAERMEKKKGDSIISTLFSRLFLKRKTDIVRLVAERGLDAEQLVQVRNALEKGLTDSQLMVLIDYRLPAEQMGEIIEIAVYENRTKGAE